MFGQNEKVENYNYEIAKYNKSTRNNILLELNEEFKNDLIWDGQFREQDFMKDSQISAYFLYTYQIIFNVLVKKKL